LKDDKGSTLIVVFGLPPMTHENDCSRSVLCAKSLQSELLKINCEVSIGIAMGKIFSGVVGTSG